MMKEDALRFLEWLKENRRGRERAISIDWIRFVKRLDFEIIFKGISSNCNKKEAQIYANKCARWLKDNNKMIGNCSQGYFYITNLQEGLTVCDDEDKITDARRARTKRRREAIQREYSTEPELNL